MSFKVYLFVALIAAGAPGRAADAADTGTEAICRTGTGDAAINACTTALQGPNLDATIHVRLLLARARAYIITKQYDLAIADCTEAIKLKPLDAPPLVDRGVALARKGQYDLAIADYSRALELKPSDGQAVEHRALAYERKNDYERAITDFSQAIQLNADKSIAYEGRARGYLATFRFDLAAADYTEALRLKPNNVVLLVWRCYSRAAAGKDLTGALADCRQALKLEPGNTGALGYLAFTELRMGHNSDAIRDFTSALAAKPDDPENLFGRGVARLRAGEVGGYDDIASALKRDPGVEIFYDREGVVIDVSNPEMKAIFDADQSDRMKMPIDWKVVGPADDRRWHRTHEMLEQGQLHTGDDYFEAAFVFQHGGNPDSFLLAHVVATIAVAKGKAEASWIAAATLDRYLMNIGHKQIFGTQTWVPDPAKPPTVEPYDRELIPENVRLQMILPTSHTPEKARAAEK